MIAGPWLLLLGFLLFVILALGIALVVVVVSTSRRRPSGNPNLRLCEDCGGMVSLRAVRCPHCGCPVQGK